MVLIHVHSTGTLVVLDCGHLAGLSSPSPRWRGSRPAAGLWSSGFSSAADWRVERLPQDFMNVVPAVPDRDLSLELVSNTVLEVGTLPGIFKVIYDLISKPAGTTE